MFHCTVFGGALRSVSQAVPTRLDRNISLPKLRLLLYPLWRCLKDFFFFFDSDPLCKTVFWPLFMLLYPETANGSHRFQPWNLMTTTMMMVHGGDMCNHGVVNN